MQQTQQPIAPPTCKHQHFDSKAGARRAANRFRVDHPGRYQVTRCGLSDLFVFQSVSRAVAARTARRRPDQYGARRAA